MTSEKSRPTEAQWLEHKTFIRQEYLVKDASLKHLTAALAARGLHATKAQLEYKLKKWHFSKNLDRQSWQSIERKINIRKSQGKESEVFHYGRRLDRLKVAKEMRRHSETNIFKQLAAQTDAPSPVNSQLIVCTPPSFEINMEWPESLPWLRFLNQYWNSAQLLFQPSTLTIAPAQQFGPLLKILDMSASVTISGASHGVSKLASLLSNIMPESYPGEHSRTAQSLITSTIDESFLDLFKILVYKISNGTRLVHYAEWEMISTILRTSLRGLPQNLKTLLTDSVIFRAFLDSIFQHEIYHRTYGEPNAALWPLDLIRWLLELGQDPNCPLDLGFGPRRTPIGKAIQAGDLELAQLLFRFHARVDDSQAKSDENTIIDIALQSSKSDVVKVRTLKLLLQYDSGIDMEEVLSAAISLRDMELVQTILYQDVDVTKQVVPTQHYSHLRINLERYLDFKSPLTTSAIAGDDFLTLMLNHLERSDRITRSITVDLLIAAAFGRSVGIMHRLLVIRPFSTSNSQGSTPLQAAVAGGNLPVCQMILGIDQRVPPGLVYLAASCGHEDVLLMLLRFAPNVLAGHWNQGSVGLMRNRCCSSCLLDRIIGQSLQDLEGPAIHCLTILIERGARVEEGDIAKFAYHWMEKPLKAALASGGNPDDQDHQGLTALQCVLMRPDERSTEIDKSPLIVEILLRAKAKLRGGEVVAAIQNENKACISLLSRYGATLGDCDSTGETCLEAAIFAQNTELIQHILEELDPSVDLRPVCAALQMEDRALVEQLLLRLDIKEECLSMQATAIGLAATCGYFDILDELQSRFSPFGPPAPHKALLPYRSTTFGELKKLVRKEFHSGLSSKRLRVPVLIYPCKICRSTPCVKASPLALAAYGENASGFQKLVEKGYRACSITLTLLADLEKNEILTEFVELLKIYQPRLEHVLPLPGMKSPLFTALDRRNITLVRYLVEGGMDVNAYDKTSDDLSPLQMAAWGKDLDVVHYLLGKGATVNAPPALGYGITALQVAVKGCHIELANILIERGARVNARGARISGGTALGWAAKVGHIDMLQFLLHRGAITNGPGRRQFVIAVGLAMRFGHYAVVNFLKRECGWTKSDEGLLQQYSDYKRAAWYDWGEGCVVCRTYCCDEIHDSNASCIFDYSAKEEESFADVCRVCNELDDPSESDDEVHNKGIPCRHEAVEQQTDWSVYC